MTVRHRVLSCLLLALMGPWGSSASAADVGCAVFVPDLIVPGEPFDVRVSRIPGYPGGWIAPDLRLTIVYPTNSGWEYKQIDQRSIFKMGITRIDAVINPPASIYPSVDGALLSGGRVRIRAVVTQGGGATSRALCTATSDLL